MTWVERAACNGTETPDDFFPDKESGVRMAVAKERAYELCDRCPVARECGAAGVLERDGIWGGELKAWRR